MLKQLDNPNVSGREHHALELLRLALPIIGMTVSRMAMGFIDFVMVSQLGTEAQAAISPATIFVFALACFGMGAAQSIQTFVSQADGRGEPQRAGRFAWQALYMAAFFGVLTYPVVVTTDVWYAWIAAAGNQPPRVAALVADYVRISLWSVAPAVACAGLDGFFNGVQKPRVALIATLTSLVANVIGNWLLIFGQWGFPAMGIAGAALATVIAWMVRAAILVAAMLLPEFDRRFRTRRALGLAPAELGQILRVGGPIGVQWLVDIGAWVVFMALIVPPFGTVAMAASNVALQYMHLSFMPAIGIGVALCSQVGFAIGEGRPEGAIAKTRVAMWVTGAYMGAVGLLMWLAGEPLMRLFNDDPEVIRTGRWVLIWAAIFQVFDAMGITYMNALRGAGDTRWPAIVVGLCCWVIFVGGGYAIMLVLPQLGFNGPWMVCTTYICVLGLLLWWRWHRGGWRAIRLFDETARVPLAGPEAAAAAPAVLPD